MLVTDVQSPTHRYSSTPFKIQTSPLDTFSSTWSTSIFPGWIYIVSCMSIHTHTHTHTHHIPPDGESKKTHHLALPLTHPRQRLPPQGSNLLSFPPRTNRKNMALDKLLQIPPCPLLALLPLIRLRLA